MYRYTRTYVEYVHLLMYMCMYSKCPLLSDVCIHVHVRVSSFSFPNKRFLNGNMFFQPPRIAYSCTCTCT